MGLRVKLFSVVMAVLGGAILVLAYLYVGVSQDAPHVVTITMVKGSYQPVEIEPEGYRPDPVTLVIGFNNTVVWVNEDSAPHTAHSDIPGFDTGIVQPGGSFKLTFRSPGIWTYHCHLHPWRTGKVIVIG